MWKDVQVEKNNDVVMVWNKEMNAIEFIYRGCPKRGNLHEFEDRINIKKSSFVTLENLETKEIWSDVIILRFTSIYDNKKIVEKMFQHHVELVERDEYHNYFDALKATFDYFANETSELSKKVFIDDLIEGCLILKAAEAGVDIMRSGAFNANGYFEFSINGIEYNTIHMEKYKGELKIVQTNFNEVTDHNYVVVQATIVSDKTNILELYDLIEKHNLNLTEELKMKRIWFQSIEKNILNTFTINFDSVKISLLNSELLPVINIRKHQYLNSIKLNIRVSDNLVPFNFKV